jgi:hypothetical protein
VHWVPPISKRVRHGQNVLDTRLILLWSCSLPGVAAAGAPAEKALSIPQFGCAEYAWSKVSDDFQTIEGAGPGPVTYDKNSPYTNNQRAGAGRPITLRIADLSNPILKRMAIESMRKANDLAAAGKAAGQGARQLPPGWSPWLSRHGPSQPALHRSGPQRGGADQ